MPILNWIKCEDTWCDLVILDTSQIPYLISGVYIIWLNQPNLLPRVIDVGSGIISQRIDAHRNEDFILMLKSQGYLHVTWAVLEDHLLRGVESFLADTYDLRGLKGRRYPDEPHVVVNLPAIS